MARILLDLTPLVTSASRRGIGRYVRGLVQGLDELGPASLTGLEIQGLAANDDVGSLLPPIADLRQYVEREPTRPVEHADIKRSTLVTFDCMSASRRGGADLLHLTEPRGVPLGRRPIVTVTAHDLIVLAQRHLYLPPVPGWKYLYRALEHLRYHAAVRILAISQATKRDLVELLGFDERRIDVVYHGVDHHRFCSQAQIGEGERVAELLGSTAPYIVYFGAGDARKDLDTLVEAHARVAKQGVRLVFAGHLKAPRQRGLEALAERLGTRSAVHFAGFVAEELVPALYRQAAMHVFPSRYEGFGLPILEAMACGTPTITSPGSSLEEVAAGAAEIVPCGDAEALASALERLLADSALRTAMCERGLAHVRRFTWANCADATLRFWRKSLEQPLPTRDGIG